MKFEGSYGIWDFLGFFFSLGIYKTFKDYDEIFLDFFWIFWIFFIWGYMRLLTIITRFLGMFWDFLELFFGEAWGFLKLFKIQLTCLVRMHRRTKCYYISEQIRLEYLFLLLASCSEGSTLSISLS